MAQMQQAVANLKRQHDSDAAELKKLEKLIMKATENYSEYSKQKLENEMVLKELSLLGEDAAVFKKIGPCLIKQDNIEARVNVEKRVEYITAELERTDKQQTAWEEKRRNLAQNLKKVQDQVQQIMHSASQAES